MAKEDSRFWDYVESKGNEYPADAFSEYLRTFFTNGLPGLGTNLQVSASDSGMQVKVDYGAAVILGYAYWLRDNNTGVKNMPIVAASSSYARIDRIVLHLDKSAATAATMLVVKTGTPAASPSAPALTREGNVYEISLAQILVGAGVLSITADKVTDERSNNDLCGLVEPWKVRQNIDQGVKTTDSPTFVKVTATTIVGAVFQ